MTHESSQQRILVVDDSKLILRLGRRALEKAGYAVETVTTPDEVRASLQNHGTPDLLLVDINMPEMAGDDLVRMIRGEMGSSRVPVVLFSDIKEEELARRAEASGATTFISKHWGLDRLVTDVQRILAECAAAEEATPPANETTTHRAASATGNGTGYVSHDTRRGSTTQRRTLEDIAGDSSESVVVSSGNVSGSSRAPRVPVNESAEAPEAQDFESDAEVEPVPLAEAEPVSAPAPDDEWDSSATGSSTSASTDQVTLAARGRLLVIDDSNLIGKVVNKAFTKAGFQVIVCTAFDEIQPALDTFGRPSLILVDINMPDIMGDDLVVYFRTRLAIDSPIIMFSNVSEKELEFRAKESGADGFISKRWGVDRMVEEVEACLARKSGE